MEKEKWAHIDLGNQIDNSWNKDTALALKLDGLSFAVKIRAEDKKRLREENSNQIKTRKDERHNRKIVIGIYAFMLFKLLISIKSMVRKVKLCNDICPHEDVYRYLNLVCRYYKVEQLDAQIRIRFKDKDDGRSKAHHVANKTYKGRRKEDYLIKQQDVQDLNEILKVIGKDGS